MGGELRIWASNYDLPNLDDQLHHLRCGVNDGPGCEMMEGYAMSIQGSVTPSLENVKRTEEVGNSRWQVLYFAGYPLSLYIWSRANALLYIQQYRLLSSLIIQQTPSTPS